MTDQGGDPGGGPATASPDVPLWRSRSAGELVADQLAGLDAWNAAHRQVREEVSRIREASREMQLDLRRSMDARRHEQAALLARAALQLEQSAQHLQGAVPARAVLAHRNTWFRDKVAGRLTEHGVTIVATVDDGAEAIGTVVVEQPELVLIEDRLPTLTGRQVLERLVAFAPNSLVAAQVESDRDLEVFLSAGAGAVFSRRVAPADVADELVRCLFGRPRMTLVARQESGLLVSKPAGNTR